MIQQILDGWNPLYYGRYVDDILLVEKVEKGSRIAQKAQDGKLEFYEAFEYYTVNNSRWTGKETGMRGLFSKKKKTNVELTVFCQSLQNHWEAPRKSNYRQAKLSCSTFSVDNRMH